MHKRNDIHCPTKGIDHVTWWRSGEFENAHKFNTTLDDTTLYDTMHNNNTIVTILTILTILTIVVAATTLSGIFGTATAAAAAFPSPHGAVPIDAHECGHRH